MANATTQFGGFLTNTGIAQQANTAVLGLPWNITHMLIGDAGGDPSQTPDPTPKPTQTALVRQVYRAQLNALYQSPADPGVLVAELVLPPETGGWWIRELALEDANGNFIAVAKPAPSYKPLLAQGSGRTQTIRMHVVFGNLANVTLKVDPSIVLATRDYVDKAREAAELYARNQLKAHVDAADPHPQYLRRADAAKDVGPLAWLGIATGTADALTLKLKSGESALAAYAAGQRFQFQASATNTGAVTARINGLAAVAVKKSGNAGLVDLVGGDIRAGALYDLNYDGTYFQLGGGVGANKAFERYSFEASVGQTVFTLAHTIGNTIVLRNGREITDYLSDGQKITFKAPCSLGEAVEILAFSSFQAANSYTKAETQALLNTASALPVGTMLPFPRGTVPAGFLEVDGSTQSAAVYPDLAAYLGGAFNTGNEAAGFFRLPDTRGEFLRGWDHGRGVDSGRAMGSTQGEAFKAHTHKDIGFIDNVGGGAGASAVTGATGEVTSLYGKAYGNSASATAKAYKESAPGALGGAIAGLITGSTGDSETRPRNLAVMWCIKAWNAPVNQGQIDVAALVAELKALRSSTPVGAILPFPKAEVPAGYLELDGSLQSVATYPDLAAYLGASYNNGTEPAGYFRLPDYRGEFLRGWDHGRGVDAGRAVGSSQLDALQNITGKMGDFTRSPANTAAFGEGALSANSTGSGGSADGAGVNYFQLTFDASRTARTAAETRPRNLAVMWCIKAWSAPVNQGQIDVAALVAELANLRSSTPVGAILPFPKAQVPAGYLEADGSVQSISAYPDLAAYLGATYNKGDEGAGNFRLPDYRGEFLRGWDHGRGVDAGRALGSKQGGSSLRAVASNASQSSIGNTWANTEFDELAAQNYYASPSSGALSSVQSGTVRPRNLAVMWCIKAWNAPVNQGQIDVAALAPLAAQAAETVQGTAKVATQAMTDAGVDDATIITPKKLRAGFLSSFTSNGYIVFPSWLGGLVIQWGGLSVTGTATVPLPIAWPTGKYFGAWGVGQTGFDGSVGGSAWVETGTVSASQIFLKVIAASASGNVAGSRGVSWLAIGK